MSWGPAWHPGAQEIKEIYGRGLSDLEQFEIWAGTGDQGGRLGHLREEKI